MLARYAAAALGVCLSFAAAAAAPLVIGGTVITPTGPVPNAWVVIDQGKIVSIMTTPPAIPGSKMIPTTDLIFPGFVDLHNHPLYNVIPRWQPGRLFDNRYQWRNDAGYKAAIAGPQSALMKAGGVCDDDEFSEVKALIGGTTSIIGISSYGTVPACFGGLARNLDLATGFYPRGAAERIRNEIGVEDQDNLAHDMTPQKAAEIRAQLAHGDLDLFAVHIGEGKRSDKLSQGELDLLDKAQLLTSRTAIVHGVALDAAAFARVHKAGASLVWSPRSNMELYGETTDIGAARAAQVPVALAPDWSPSGSDNTLAEIRYAAALDPAKSGATLTPKDLFDMATSVPAKIAHIDDRVGSLVPGLYADLFLIPGDPAKPYDALVQSQPGALDLVMVAGEPIYGKAEFLTAFGATTTEAVTVCTAQRALNSNALPEGPLAATMTRIDTVLKAQKPASHLAPLAECPPSATPAADDMTKLPLWAKKPARKHKRQHH
jgi:cytosine/adenosine deaminase-related metal-dependent hydrolase